MPKKLNGMGIVLATVLLLVVGFALWSLWNKRDRPVEERKEPELFPRAVETVAAAEDGRYETAMEGWAWLVEQRPGDESLVLNQAVTALKWIDQTSSLLGSGSVTDPQQLQQRKDELARALAEAERIVSQISNSSSEAGRKAYLEAAVLEAKAQQLAYPADEEVRLQAAQRISLALAQDPAQAMLACKLDDLSQELGGDNEQLAQTTADSLFASWKASPRNLYLLVRAGELLLERKDARVVELLDSSLELAKPMMSMLAPALGQRKAADLVTSAKQAIADNQWNGAQPVRMWFNVLKSSTAFSPDRRLVKPDLMALLSTTFLQRWREEMSEPAAKGAQLAIETNYNSVAMQIPDGASPATAIQWYDYDLDGQFELLVAGGRELRLMQWDTRTSQVTQLQNIELPLLVEGMQAVDLFEVDSTQRPRVMPTVAELAAAPASAPPAEAVAADQSHRHDTIQEVIVWSADAVALVTSRETEPGSASRVLEIIADVSGLSQLQGVGNIEPVDMDSDGDLDLVVTTQAGLRFLQNNGNRTFQDVSQFSSVPADGWPPEQMAACDYDRDLDLDLICVSKSAPYVAVLENILHNQFRFVGLTTGAWLQSGPVSRLAVAELDGNGSWDWCFLGAQNVTSVFTRTTADSGVVADRQDSVSPEAARGLQLADINNDTFIDAITATDAGIFAHYGGPGGYFQANPSKLLVSIGVTALDCIDANGDGSIDIAALINGRPVLLQALPLPAGGYVEARLRGINDINGGGRINHYATGSVVELWSNSRFQAQVVRQPVVHFGLGNEPPINLRVVFNNGLTQNVEAVEANTLVLERQELKGSCPFVYGWDGQRFQLITDLLWNAPLGLQIERGRVFPDRRWEYLVLPGNLVQPRDGAYELRVTEELWEIAYFDHIALTAVDHPRDVEIFNNEKVGPAEIAQPKLFSVSKKVYPTRAVDGYGRDCLEKLVSRDQVYVQAFQQQICQGLCEPHFIELEFDAAFPAGEAKLFLTGWLHPTDTSLNISIAQNADVPAPEPPSLWIASKNGDFRCAQPFIGFPGGKPKTIAVDLESVLTSNDRRLRIAGSQQIYWDEAFISLDEPPVASWRVLPAFDPTLAASHIVADQSLGRSGVLPAFDSTLAASATAASATTPVATHDLKLESAVFGYRGFSRLLPRLSDQPHWYDYQVLSTAAKWPPLDGPYTRYGVVSELLRDDDDRMVIMGSGDEVVLRFAIPNQNLPNGWKRDFVMYNVGWDKDADLNTLAGQSTLPLPFRLMDAYPPPVSQESEAQGVWDLNAPTLIERRSSSDFWKHPSAPRIEPKLRDA